MNVQSLTVRHHRLLFVNRYLPRTSRHCYSSTPRGWRKYTEQFKNKPGSYITTFAILHELTAIVPFPFIYYGLSWSDLRLPVPEQAIHQGNRIVNKVRVRNGFEALEPDNRAMVHLATTYAIVKILVPLRIGASVAMTPMIAEKWVGPLMASLGTLMKKFKPS
ncbi:hypothetical protein [Absidia glauca]|uniref:Uncharacterized protein n=1 Tax=Absidia glauca TaxID=4829 RepID=A0A163KMB3_ABSGL|nr:hypothetical protein [Absidia glauca]